MVHLINVIGIFISKDLCRMRSKGFLFVQSMYFGFSFSKVNLPDVQKGFD